MEQRENEPMRRLRDIESRIAAAAVRAGRRPDEVMLVAASKTVDARRLQPFIEADLRHVGENYVQEGVAKIGALSASLPGVHWHLIGALQSNKAREAVAAFELIHSVDRLSLARALDRAVAAHADGAGKTQRVLLQVNLGDEESKAGCRLEELPALAQSCATLAHLKVEGLMCLPPYNDDAEATRPFFAALRNAREELARSGLGDDNWQLSMGMSHDFEIAIEEGATLVRIGRALFGQRPIK